MNAAEGESRRSSPSTRPRSTTALFGLFTNVALVFSPTVRGHRVQIAGGSGSPGGGLGPYPRSCSWAASWRPVACCSSLTE